MSFFIPFLTPALASASINIYTKAGEQPARTPKRGKLLSGSSIISPTAPKIFSISFFSSSATLSLVQYALHAAATFAFIFGIMRTILLSCERLSLIKPIVFPAAIETRTVSYSSSSILISFRTLVIILGLTASTTYSQSLTTSIALLQLFMEYFETAFLMQISAGS